MERNGKSNKELIAVSARQSDFRSEVYERFGRAYWFMLYSPADDCWKAFNNEFNRARTDEAGVATVRALLEFGVTVVLTGETGPRAFRALTTAGVVVVQNVAGSVEEAVQSWCDQCLVPARQANDPGSPHCLLRRCQPVARKTV